MTGAMERAKQVDRATGTVEAVASILKVLANGEHDRGNIPMMLIWLGTQLEDAGMVLSGGGEP